ncbi:MAG TPA: hypothetical protein VGJ59_06510 [Jatrophihabitantaceae bacterium]|jgi:hypothetical protein
MVAQHTGVHMANDSPQRSGQYWLALAAAGIGITAASVLVVKAVLGGDHEPRAAPSTTSQSAPPSSTPPPPLDPARRDCSARPSECGYPDASNTGISPGLVLHSSGCITARDPGQVIENVSIKGCTIDVSARNVTIRNVKIVIDSPELWAIIVRGPGSATIDHVDISGIDGANHSVEYAVLSQTTNPVTVTHANLHNCADCIQGEYVTATDNYIHDVGGPPAAHLDGIQCDSNHGCHLTATHNTVLSKGIAIALYGDFGTPVNTTISNNLVGGGSYTVYGGTSKSINIHITDNRFSRAIYPNGGIWGPVAYFWPHNPGNTFTGNIWDDTGKPVTARVSSPR